MGPALVFLVSLDGGPVRPAELVVGKVQVRGRFSLLATGSFASKSFAEFNEGSLMGGLGGGWRLTPDGLLYTVDILGRTGFTSDGAALGAGFTVQAKF